MGRLADDILPVERDCVLSMSAWARNTLFVLLFCACLAGLWAHYMETEIPVRFLFVDLSVDLCLCVRVAFSLLMAHVIYSWLRKYQKHIPEALPMVGFLAWAAASLILIASVAIPRYWLLAVSFFWVAALTLLASIRHHISREGETAGLDGIAVLESVALCGGACFAIGAFQLHVARQHTFNWLTLLGPALVVLPRLFTDRSSRSVRTLGSYTWFRVYPIFAFASSGAQVGHDWLLNSITRIAGREQVARWWAVIEQGKEAVFSREACSSNLVLFFVFLGMLGVMGYAVFPDEELGVAIGANSVNGESGEKGG